MYSIIREEGSSLSPKDKAATALGKAPRRRKGQGVQGLYQGWRLGLWSLVGVWGAGFIGGLQGGAEPATEGVAAHAGKF
jgi:fusion and transport protein UGO1